MHLVNLKRLALVSFCQIKRQWSIRPNLMLHASFRLTSPCIRPKNVKCSSAKNTYPPAKKVPEDKADELLTPSTCAIAGARHWPLASFAYRVELVVVDPG